ncbi:hypothetical protein ACFPN7_42755 [Amycolatopsis halotolerans]|uniref:hypothetical protein n=1 Tax=Amycolatopsis halotolerans TaxID=330083 RepID=UPI0036226633
MPRGGPAGWRSVEAGQRRVTDPAATEVTAGYPRPAAQVGPATTQVGGPHARATAVFRTARRARDGSHSASGRALSGRAE